MGYIIKMITLPDGNTTIILQGRQRFKVADYIREEPYMIAKVTPVEDYFPNQNKKESNYLVRI